MKLSKNQMRLLYPEAIEREELRSKEEKDVLFTDTNYDLLTELFAPDSITGFPCNSLHIVLNSNTPPEVQEYVRKFMQVLPPQIGATSDDDALDLASPLSNQFGEERDAYNQRVLDFVEDTNNSEESSNESE